MRLIPASLLLFLACDQPATEAAPAQEPAAQSASTSTSAITDDQVVGTWNGGQVTYAELREEASLQLIQIEAEYLNNRYQVESQALEEVLMGKILEEEAKAKGHADVDALLNAEISSQVKDPSEVEIQALYEMVKRRLGGASLEEVREDIVSEIRHRAEAELFSTYVVDLKERTGAATTLPFPDLPRIPVSADDDPFLGTDGAPVTIIQFAEFQCPYCGKAKPVVDQVLEAYEGKIKMVYRDFPLSGHDRAVPAAVAANCASAQDPEKYWEMYDLLMNDQRSLEDDDLIAHAKTLNLDMKKWNKCRDDPAQVAEVLKDQADGIKAGVSGTPAFFVNGILISGAQPFEQFKLLIDRELGIE